MIRVVFNDLTGKAFIMGSEKMISWPTRPGSNHSATSIDAKSDCDRGLKLNTPI